MAKNDTTLSILAKIIDGLMPDILPQYQSDAKSTVEYLKANGNKKATEAEAVGLAVRVNQRLKKPYVLEDIQNQIKRTHKNK